MVFLPTQFCKTQIHFEKLTFMKFHGLSLHPPPSLPPFNSSSLSCISAWNRAEPSEGETNEPEDGQQVGKCGGVHRRDSERGAGMLHA